jgi:FdhD protein
MANPVEYFTDGHARPIHRDWVGEAPVALEFNGVAYAVMMATPTDLADFATGFALTEGLAASASDITHIAIAEVPLGWVARATIPTLSPERLATRIRTRVAESSCGLCGIESLEALARPLPPVPPHDPITPAAIFAALAQLPALQTLGKATGAAHAAAWANDTGQIGLVREDVGRHTALDKLAGAMARAHRPLTPGFVLSTARCSFEIVEKSVRAGATTLVTISLPTTLAVERARAAGLGLWALARPDSVLAITP